MAQVKTCTKLEETIQCLNDSSKLLYQNRYTLVVVFGLFHLIYHERVEKCSIVDSTISAKLFEIIHVWRLTKTVHFSVKGFRFCYALVLFNRVSRSGIMIESIV